MNIPAISNPRCEMSRFQRPVPMCVMASAYLLMLSSQAMSIPVSVNFVNDTTDIFFPVSATDLINQGEPTFLSEVSVGFTSFAGSATANLNNGSIGGSLSNPDLAFDLDATWKTTFNLDLTTGPLGYDITQIDSFAGWATSNYGQRYEVLLSKVGDPTFTSVGTFTNSPPITGSRHSTLIEITDTTGFLGTEIDAIQFSFLDPGGSSGSGALREIDVIGFATFQIPEPSTVVLLGLGVVGLAWQVRRRRAIGRVAKTDRCE